MTNETTTYNSNRRIFEVIPPIAAITSNQGTSALQNILGENQLGFTPNTVLQDGNIDYTKLIYHSPKEWETGGDESYWEFTSNHGDVDYRNLRVQSAIGTYVHLTDGPAPITDVQYMLDLNKYTNYISRRNYSDFGGYVTRGNISKWFNDMIYTELDTNDNLLEEIHGVIIRNTVDTAEADLNLSTFFRKSVRAITKQNIIDISTGLDEDLLLKATFSEFMGSNTLSTSTQLDPKYKTLDAVFNSKLGTYLQSEDKTDTNSMLMYRSFETGEVVGTKVSPTRVPEDILSFTDSGSGVDGIHIPNFSADAVTVNSIFTSLINTDGLRISPIAAGNSIWIKPVDNKIMLGLSDTANYLELDTDVNFPKSRTLNFEPGITVTLGNQLKYDVSLDLSSPTSLSLLPKSSIVELITDAIVTVDPASVEGDILTLSGTKTIKTISGFNYDSPSSRNTWGFTTNVSIDEAGRPIFDNLLGTDVLIKSEITDLLATKMSSNYEFIGTTPNVGANANGGIFSTNVNDGKVEYTVDILRDANAVNISKLRTNLTYVHDAEMHVDYSTNNFDNATDVNFNDQSVINARDIKTLITAKTVDFATNTSVAMHATFLAVPLPSPEYNSLSFVSGVKTVSNFKGITINNPAPIQSPAFLEYGSLGALPYNYESVNNPSEIQNVSEDTLNKSIYSYITGEKVGEELTAEMLVDVNQFAIPSIVNGFGIGLTGMHKMNKRHFVNIYQYSESTEIKNDGLVDWPVGSQESIFSPISYSFDNKFSDLSGANDDGIAGSDYTTKQRFEDVFAATISNPKLYGENDLLPKSAIYAMMVEIYDTLSDSSILLSEVVKNAVATAINNYNITSDTNYTSPDMSDPIGDKLALEEPLVEEEPVL